MEQLLQYWQQYAISNSIALLILLLAWKRPIVGCVCLGVVFMAASFANSYVALTNPADYLNYSQFVVLQSYRDFINGWFAEHTQITVLGIAAGQLLIGLGMILRGPLLKPAIVGIVVFGLAIAPFGVGSAFPCTVLLAWAATLLWDMRCGSRLDDGHHEFIQT